MPLVVAERFVGAEQARHIAETCAPEKGHGCGFSIQLRAVERCNECAHETREARDGADPNADEGTVVVFAMPAGILAEGSRRHREGPEQGPHKTSSRFLAAPCLARAVSVTIHGVSPLN